MFSVQKYVTIEIRPILLSCKESCDFSREKTLCWSSLFLMHLRELRLSKATSSIDYFKWWLSKTKYLL